MLIFRMITSFIICILMCSCESETKFHSDTPNTTTFTNIVMTMKYRIVIGDYLSNEKQYAVDQIIQHTFSEINAIYNKWNPNSEISKLNNLKAGEIAPLSSKLENFLLRTQQIVILTEGRFDPTIEPLQRLWKEKLSQKQVPSETEIMTIIPALGWDKIHFHEGEFYKDHSLTQLDLGGIAKGYCVDLLVERLNASGFHNVFVEWGGEIRTSGNHPDQRPWRIFISRIGDTDQKNAIATLDLKDQAIATSGDYLQFWTIDERRSLTDNTTNKKTYFHIFNPFTYQPLEITPQSIASASVLAPTCLLADGLATAAMMFPSQKEAEAWLENVKQNIPELEFWIAVRAE